MPPLLVGWQKEHQQAVQQMLVGHRLQQLEIAGLETVAEVAGVRVAACQVGAPTEHHC
jgi:hypothetical protein